MRKKDNAFQLNKTWDDFKPLKQPIEIESIEVNEVRCKKLEANNIKLLASYKHYLTHKEGLSPRVIRQHVENADLYLNDYLLYHDFGNPVTSLSNVQLFISDWFVRKTSWSSVSSIKTLGTSMKKLFKFLTLAGELSNEDQKIVYALIKDSVEEGTLYLIQEEEDYYNDDLWD